MDALDASAKSTSEIPPRIRYERDLIFSIKEHVISSNTDIFDNIDLNTLAQRAGRGKPSKHLSLGKGQPDRSREPKSIVLGPQKRTWNTGCHVSQTGSREASENSGRGGRPGSEYRMNDRYSKHPTDHKKEYRSGPRDRGSARRADGSYATYVDDRHKHYFEEEPEWFSGGPTTVSETIELGGIVEGDVECAENHKGSNPTIDPSLEKPADMKTFDNSTSPVAVTLTNDSLKSEEATLSTENQGSRFKSLFSTADGASSSKKVENINEQLLRLLKGTTDSDVAEQYRNNVLQVENKLRSILLGRRVSPDNSENVSKVTEVKVENQKILTVEEIESQLISPSTPVHSSKANFESTVERFPSDGVAVSPKSQQQAMDLSNKQSSLESNLASILQSLALKQQQIVSSKPSAVHHGALSSLGILSNPVVRLPSATNAVSASARINQLNQSETGASGLGVSTQGILGQLLEGNPVMSSPSTAHGPSQIPNSAQLLLPRSATGLSSNQNPEVGTRTGLATLSLNLAGLAVPRRPIVKNQLGIPVVSVDGCNSSVMQKHSLGPQDNQSLLSTATGQQMHTSDDKLLNSHAFPGMRNDARIHLPTTPQFPDSLSTSVGSANNSYFQPRPLCGRHQSGNTLEFLSHLVEMDRSGVSLGSRKPSGTALNPLLSVAMKAKTLEEIERQEIFNTDTFF